jgi:hypothetical protein
LRHRAPVAAHERPGEALGQGIGQQRGSLEHQRVRRVMCP